MRHAWRNDCVYLLEQTYMARQLRQAQNTSGSAGIEKGLVTDFKNCAADTRFETPRIEPVNVTEDIANRLVEKFNKVAKKYAALVGWVMRAASKVKNAFGL